MPDKHTVRARKNAPESQRPCPRSTRLRPPQARGNQGLLSLENNWDPLEICSGDNDSNLLPTRLYACEKRKTRIAPKKVMTSATRLAGTIRTTAITSRLELPAAAKERTASTKTTSG